MFVFFLLLAVLSPATAVAQSLRPAAQPSAESRVVAFLIREVPRWRAEHPCYSCHNNGDAARALLVASQRGHDIGASLDDTMQWLQQPARWGDSPSNRGFDDKTLARIQFASALRLATRTGRAPLATLQEAATILVRDQQKDGSWQLDNSQSIGSPTTYGTVLATATARVALVAAKQHDLDPAIARATGWLATRNIETVIDAAGVLIGLADAVDDQSRAQRERALAIIRRGQAPGGGWGPYVTSPPEVFDTALVMLALQNVGARDAAMMSKARNYLLAQQLADGSWPETTRPTGQESYAQRISTTGWALLALLGGDGGSGGAEDEYGPL